MKSGLSGWVLAIARTLDTAGVSHAQIFAELGMDETKLKKGSSRYTQEMVSNLWLLAVETTDDPYFGLKVATNIRPSSFHVVGYSMSCSATLGDALRRFAHYAKLISSSATVEFVEQEPAVKLSFIFETGGKCPIDQALDAALGGIVHFSNGLVEGEVRPIEVHFQHKAPADAEEYVKALKCPVKFEQDIDCVVFHPSDMDREILSADEHLASILDTVAINQMAELSGRFSQKLRTCLRKLFPTGDISKNRAAATMRITERTLLRRLRTEGTTFQEVLDSLREELACEQLRHPGTTIQNISDMLGFSDPSSFSRAFKRWTGRRPSCTRESYQHYDERPESTEAHLTMNHPAPSHHYADLVR